MFSYAVDYTVHRRKDVRLSEGQPACAATLPGNGTFRP